MRLQRCRLISLVGILLSSSLGQVRPAAAAPDTVPSSAPALRSAPSADLVVNTFGDSAGLHVAVARGDDGYRWRDVAVLRPDNLDVASWTGYECTSGDGRFAAVTVLPSTAVNQQAGRDHGAWAYSVDLASGQTRFVASGVALAYHSPGCGVGADAVFARTLGVEQGETQVLDVDLASGNVLSTGSVTAQVTSVVPTPSRLVGAVGASLVSLPRQSGPVHARVVAAVAGTPYELRAAVDGGVDYLTKAVAGTEAQIWHVDAQGVISKLGSGASAAVDLLAGRAGHTVVAAGPGVSVSGLRTVGRAASDPPPLAASLDGGVLVLPPMDNNASQPRLKLTASGRTVVSDRPSGTPLAVTSTGMKGAAAAAAPSTAQSPSCSVPRNDLTRQAMQPNSTQVDWAAQMAEQGLLTGGIYQRPANFANMGLAAYSPNGDFPRIALSHPASDGFDMVPRSVMEAIAAQESNFKQASFHSPAGMTGNPLIADYYGAAGTIDSINYADADCGYGIVQVTTGMAAGDPSYGATGQAKIAVDYEENLAAGLQILEKIWNQLYGDGVIANDGSPRYLENWFAAVWAYNSGIQPTGAFNSTGCTPGPSCTGPDGTWGLGWANNPQNPNYPPNRTPFLQATYTDAAHPASWPYEERILGWMASPLFDPAGGRSYSPPTYHGGNTWLQVPAHSAFCSQANNKCDPANAGGGYCTLADFECWWHAPVSWIASCQTTCATSGYTLGSGSTEPARSNPFPPTCNATTADLPNLGAGPPIIVDDDSSHNPPLNQQGCYPAAGQGGSAPNWSSQGTFTYTYGASGAGDPIGAIDTHSLGGGFGGHLLFTHTEDGSEPGLINTGTWAPSLPSTQYYTVKIHIPALGAAAPNVVYHVYPGGGVAPFNIALNQGFDREAWVPLGTFALAAGARVVLTNQSPVGTVGYDPSHDIAFDAAAFIPRGGSPGVPLGGPPGILEAPGGSNPAWPQCLCASRSAGDPVDTATGYFTETQTDLTTPGRGVPLDLTRTYNSGLADPAGPNGPSAVNGPFGWGWTFSYGLNLSTDGGGNVTVHQEDGSLVTFVHSGSSYTPAAPRVDAKLTLNGSAFTFTRRAREIFTFDVATGHLTGETDLPGTLANPPYSTRLVYSAGGQLATITDPSGRMYTLGWSGIHITSLTDTAGRKVTYGYDGSGDLTDVLGVGTTRVPLKNNDHTIFTYEASTHLMTSLRHPKAFGSTATPTPVTAMAYDTAERVTTQTDPIGRITTFAYGPNANLTQGQTLVTDPSSHQVLYTYQNNLLVTEAHGYASATPATTTYTYDPVTLGVTSITDPNGHFQTFSYDDAGNRLSASDARGFTTIYAYDALNDLTSTIDPLGVKTTTGFDEAGHIATSGGTNSGGLSFGLATSTTVTQLNADPDITNSDGVAVAAPRGRALYYGDAAHPADVTRIVDPRASTTTMTYDAYGDLATQTDAANDTTSYGYDTARGWKISAVSPVGTAAGTTASCTPPAVGCTTYVHDAWGHVTQVTDANAHTTRLTFDANGNRTTTIDGNSRQTTNTYDFADQLTVVTRADTTRLLTHYNGDGTVLDTVDGANHKTKYTYDAQGRKATATDPRNRVTTYTYDPAGNLQTTKNPAGQVTTRVYDPANELIGITYSVATTPNVTSIVYDARGQRRSLTDGTGTSSWQYDAFGEITVAVNGAGAAVKYSYDQGGNQTSIVYPSGTQTVIQSYDTANRISSVTDPNNQKTTFGYYPDSTLKTTTYPNGATVSNSYDNASVLTATTLAGIGAPVSLTYTRDAADQLATTTPVGLPDATKTYQYSPIEQLTGVAGNTTNTPYGYDKGDNPISLAGATQAFDVANQLCWSLSGTIANPTCATVPTGATKYTYNTDGDRLSSTPATGAKTTNTYDQADRLTSTATNGTTYRYAYDGDGLRMTSSTGSTTTHFTWDAGSVPNLLSDGPTIYLYGPGGVPVEQLGLSGTSYYFDDQLGSTIALTDSLGHINATYTYDAYGNTTAHTGSATTPLRYAGQYTDAETGLLYLRNRYYDPSTGQFLSRDPAVAVTQMAYIYADENPLKEVDPLGLYPGEGLVHSAGNAVGAASRAVVDVVAVVPYAVYYGSYEAARGINAVGDQIGPIGSAVSHVVAAPLAIPEAAGLGLDARIDVLKDEWFGNESVCDEGKRGYINPLHSYLPGPLKGPQIYLPGIHANGSVDFQW